MRRRVDGERSDATTSEVTMSEVTSEAKHVVRSGEGLNRPVR